jgi:hypothetical protein
VARLVRDSGENEVSNIIDGAAVFGSRNYVSNVVVLKVVTTLGSPVVSVASAAAFIQAPMFMGMPVIAASKFVYNTISSMIFDIIKVSVASNTATDVKLEQIGAVFINHLYEDRQRFHDEVKLCLDFKKNFTSNITELT